MFPKKIRPFLIISLLFALLIVACLLFTNFLIQKPSVQDFLIKRLSDISGFDIQTKKIELNLFRGIGIYVHGLKAKSKKGSESITASGVRVIFDKSQLIKGRIVPSMIYLIDPVIDLTLEEEVGFFGSIENRLSERLPFYWLSGLEAIFVDRGNVNITNRSLKLRDLYFDIQRKRTSEKILSFNSRGRVGFNGTDTSFRLNGLLLCNQSLQDCLSIDVTLETEKTPLKWIPWPRAIPVRGGSFGTALRIRGNIGAFISIEGSVKIQKAHFSVQNDEDKKEFYLPFLDLDFESSIDPESIHIPSIKLKTSDLNLEISLDLNIRERQNPFMKMVVKSEFMEIGTIKKYFPTPVVPSWVGKILFPILNKGQTRLKHLTLKGKLDQFRHIKIPENNSVVGFVFNCRDFEISGKGVAIPIKDITADVILEKSSLIVSGFNGNFNGSNIGNGNLHVKEVYGDKQAYEADVTGSFDFRDIMEQAESGLIPKDFSEPFERLKSFSGRLECQGRFLYREDWKIPRIDNGVFTFKKGKMYEPDLFLPVFFDETTIVINERDVDRFDGKGSWGNSRFNIGGTFEYTGETFEFGRADISADLDIGQLVPLVSGLHGFPFRSNKLLPSRITLKKDGTAWTSQGRVELEEVFLETDDLIMIPRSGKDHIDFELAFTDGENIDIRQILLSLNGSSLSLSGFYRFSEPDILNINASIPNLSIEDLGIDFKGGGNVVRGNIKGKLAIVASLGNLFNTNVTGNLEGEDIGFSLKTFPSPVHSLRFRTDFKDKMISIPLLRMSIGESSFNMRGDLTGWDGVRGKLSIDTDFFDMKDILHQGKSGVTNQKESDTGLVKKEQVKSTLRSIMDQSVIDLKIIALKGRWRKLELGPLKALMELKGDNLYINESDIHMDHGRMKIKGFVMNGGKGPLRFDTHLRLRDQPVEELLNGLGMNGGFLKGKLTMEAILQLKGLHKGGLIPGMAGFASINIKNGFIRNPGVLIKVLKFLSLQKVFKKIPKDLPKDGFYFKNIEGNGVIDHGIFKAKDFIMKSPVLNAVAMGEADLSKKEYDLNLIIQPMETIDAIVGNIPILGYIIAGEDRKFLTYAFKVDGPWKKPIVKYVPFKNLGYGTLDTLKRILLTPIRILKKIPIKKGSEPSDKGVNPGMEMELEEERE